VDTGSIVYCLSNVRRKASRHFRYTKKEYLKSIIGELETNSKINNSRDTCRGINDFKKGYQPILRILLDEKGDLITDSPSILAKWRNHFSELLIVHGFSDVMQTEIHTAEPLVPDLGAVEVELAIEKLKVKNHQVFIKSKQNCLRQEVERFAMRSTNILFLFGIRMNCLRSGSSRSLYLSIRKAMEQIVVIMEAYHFFQLFPTPILTNILLSRLTPSTEEIVGGH
jgi:hypothetical protein